MGIRSASRGKPPPPQPTDVPAGLNRLQPGAGRARGQGEGPRAESSTGRLAHGILTSSSEDSELWGPASPRRADSFGRHEMHVDQHPSKNGIGHPVQHWWRALTRWWVARPRFGGRGPKAASKDSGKAAESAAVAAAARKAFEGWESARNLLACKLANNGRVRWGGVFDS